MPPPRNRPATRPDQLQAEEDRRRRPRCGSRRWPAWFFSLPCSASLLGCEGLGQGGRGHFQHLGHRVGALQDGVGPIRAAEAGILRFRPAAPGPAACWSATNPSIHQATAANAANSARGRNRLRKLIRMSATSTAGYTLISTILRITKAPTTCMTDGDGQHLLAQRVGEQQRDVLGIELVDGDEQHQRQGQEDDAGEAAFAGQGLDLPPDAEAVADQAADLVEDFGQVAARLPLQDHGGDEEPQVEVGDALGQAVAGFRPWAMPRFCSSNTRPNSLPIGARHFACRPC